MIGVTFFVIAIVVVAIWLIIEMKRLKHKIFAILLIGLIIFTYVSFTVSLKGKDVDLKSIGGVIDAGKLYVAWLGGIFGNLKSVTTYAFKQDWNDYEENVTKKDPGEGDVWEKLK
jgi:hypothetical protein